MSYELIFSGFSLHLVLDTRNASIKNKLLDDFF